MSPARRPNCEATASRGELGLHFEIHGEGCEELCDLVQIYHWRRVEDLVCCIFGVLMIFMAVHARNKILAMEEAGFHAS